MRREYAHWQAAGVIVIESTTIRKRWLQCTQLGGKEQKNTKNGKYEKYEDGSEEGHEEGQKVRLCEGDQSQGRGEKRN